MESHQSIDRQKNHAVEKESPIGQTQYSELLHLVMFNRLLMDHQSTRRMDMTVPCALRANTPLTDQ